VGVLASGGGAVGVVAQGGGALGAYVRDGRTFAAGRAALAAEPFDSLSWFFGPPNVTPTGFLQPMVVTLGLTVIAAAVIGLAAWVRLLRHRRDVEA
jgi:hypothetical protein